MVEMFRTAETTGIISKDGDKWQYIIKSSIYPAKTINFKSGEEAVIDFMGIRITVI